MENKTYTEWCKIFEKENDVKILDNDGGRLLEQQGKLNTKLTKYEAFDYFCRNTIMFNC